MSIKTVAKTSLAISAMALTMVQLQSVLVNKALGVAPLTAPLTSPITITPTPTQTPPLTAPQQTPVSTFTVRGTHVDQNGNPSNLTGLELTLYGPNSNATHIAKGQTFSIADLSAGTYRIAITTPTTQHDGTVYDVFLSMCRNCTQHDSFLPYSEHVPLYFYEGEQSTLGNYSNFESLVIKYVARPRQPQQGGNSGGSSGGSNNGGGSSNGGSGGSSNSGGSNGGGSNVCTDKRPGSAPLILSARATRANQVTLVWRKGWAPYNGFVVSYGTKRGITQFTTEVGDTTAATIDGLNGNTTYFFRVQAKNGCVPGDYSRELSVRTSGRVLSAKTMKKTFVSKSKKALKAVKPALIKKKK